MIEVMIALLLTAIAMLGLIGLYMSQTRASSYSRRATEATMLASDELERLRTVAVPTGTTPVDTVDVQGVTGGKFLRLSTVTPVGTEYYELLVQISWEEDGETRLLQMTGRRNQ